ncbi:hypothetical protein OSTOST_02313 [Ostertagia ostertagi]
MKRLTTSPILLYGYVQLKCIIISNINRAEVSDFFTLKMVILALLVLLLASVDAFRFKSIVMNITKKVFEDVNKKWNPYMIWDPTYSRWAMNDALKKGKGLVAFSETGWTRIGKNRLFRKNDTRSLEEKVNSTLQECFEKEGEKVKGFPNGTTYGCDGIFFPLDWCDYMKLVCFYLT